MAEGMGGQILVEGLHGKGAHVEPVACVEDVSPELAGRKNASFPHSIWQILWHMNYWMDYELRRIREERPVYPAHASESWPGDSARPNEEEWGETVGRFSTLIEGLAVLAGSPQELLLRQVSGAHPSHAQQSSSVLALLWQIAAHNSYHIGQIALLRRAFGSWPPRRGGDTW